MKRIAILLLCFFSVSSFTFAQHYRIEYTYKELSKRSSILKEVIFRDTLTNIVVKRIDVETFNPFANLNFPVLEKVTKESGQKIYDLSGKTLKDVVPERVLKNYHFIDAGKIYPSLGQVFVDNKQYENMAMLKFSFAVGDDSTMFVMYSDLYIFKSDGTELFTVKDNPYNIINADIEPNKRFLFYTYGVRIGIVPVLDGGLRIIDLNNPQNVMEFPGDEITIKFMNNNMLYFFYNGVVRENRPDRWLKILDFANMKMLTRCFTFNDMLKIKAITPEGLIYKDDSTHVEPFLPKFKLEDLKWKSYIHTGNYIDYQYFENIADGNHLKAVNFNTADGKVLKTINVREFNPFKELPFTVSDTSGYNVRYYDLKQSSPKDILPAHVYKSYSPLFNKSTVLTSGRTSIDLTGDKNNVILTYTFSVGSQSIRMATYSKLFVLNASGEDVFHQDDADAYLWQAALDESANFLCYRFAVGNNDTVIKTGYRIWDLTRKKTYVEYNFDKATYQFIAPGMICFFGEDNLKDNQAGTFVFILDLVNSKSYRKSYSQDVLLDIETINAEGIVFKSNKTEYFKKDFEGEELSWKKWNGNGK